MYLYLKTYWKHFSSEIYILMHWLLIIYYSWLTNILCFGWLQEAGSGECVIKVDLGTEEDQFLSGHAIDGRVLFPATGYLVRKNEIEF